MTLEDEQPERVARCEPPGWMAPVLLVAALLGMLVTLVALWVSFVGNGPYADPSFPPPEGMPIRDRAMWWVSTGPGASSSVATLAALTALALAVSSRRENRLIRSPLQQAAFWATALFGLLEVSALVTVTAGYLQLSRDPTLVSSYTPGLFDLSAITVCLVLAVLAGLLARTIWTAHRAVHAEPLACEPSDLSTDQPPLGQATKNVQLGQDDQAMFRRPPQGRGS